MSVSARLRQSVRGALLRWGWDVRRVRSIDRERQERTHDEAVERWRFLRNYGLNSILDIGANVGQFAALAREIVPESKIYSFEPLATCFAELSARLQTMQPAEAFPFALGESNGTATIHRNGFTPSSSLLSMNSLHWQELPQSADTTEERISIRRLDDVFGERPLETPYFVKIDVQGFEDRVLRGGERTIRGSAGVVLEMSSLRLYDGQPLFDDVYRILSDWGLVYRGNVDQWVSRKDGRILQFDGLFENVSPPSLEEPAGSRPVAAAT